MSASVEERLSTLEAGWRQLKEGLDRVEQALGKLETSVSALVEKLDARYPSQESVNLRFEAVQTELKLLHSTCEEQRTEIERIKKWQYKVIGGGLAIGFLAGLVANGMKW